MGVIIFIEQMRKLILRVVKSFIYPESHSRYKKWQSWNLT